MDVTGMHQRIGMLQSATWPAPMGCSLVWVPQQMQGFVRFAGRFQSINFCLAQAFDGIWDIQPNISGNLCANVMLLPS